MKKKYPKIIYDKESKVFSVEMKQGKSVDSEIHDSLVIDYDKNGKIIRVNLYDFNLNAFKESKIAVNEFTKARNAVIAIAR